MVAVPRAKKLAGQAVDRRNGQQVELPRVQLEYFPCPLAHPSDDAVAAWEMAWADPVHEAWTPADGPILKHWIEHYERAARSARRADRRPVVPGSTGQPSEHPSYSTMSRSTAEVWKAAQVLGLGALHREKLGISIAERQKSLDGLADDFPGAPGGDREPDPRLS